MIKFYVLSYGGDSDIKIIASNNKYEAFGYYMLHVQKGTGCADDVDIQEVSPIHKIVTSCIGIPKYETVEELFSKKDSITPCVVIGLDEYVA